MRLHKVVGVQEVGKTVSAVDKQEQSSLRVWLCVYPKQQHILTSDLTTGYQIVSPQATQTVSPQSVASVSALLLHISRHISGHRFLAGHSSWPLWTEKKWFHWQPGPSFPLWPWFWSNGQQTTERKWATTHFSGVKYLASTLNDAIIYHTPYYTKIHILEPLKCMPVCYLFKLVCKQSSINNYYHCKFLACQCEN